MVTTGAFRRRPSSLQKCARDCRCRFQRRSFLVQLSANNKHARKKTKRRYKEQRRNRAIYGLCPTLSLASSSARIQLLACRDGSAQLRFREMPIASASQVVSPASARDCRHSDTLLLSSNTPRKASPPLLKGFRWPVLLTCKQHKKTCWSVYRACGMYSASPYTITLPTVSPFFLAFFFFLLNFKSSIFTRELST